VEWFDSSGCCTTDDGLHGWWSVWWLAGTADAGVDGMLIDLKNVQFSAAACTLDPVAPTSTDAG
jgi:hypothetical protein